MAAVNQIDSNRTGTSYAKEETIGVLPVTPVWKPVEPNSFPDFGADRKLVARNPINASRQRKKGTIVDLDAAAGFDTDVTQLNLQDLLQGFMFAAAREKGVQVVTAVDIDTSNPDEYELTSSAGFLVGSLIKGFGFTNSANNGLYPVTAIVANTSVEVATGQLVAETPPAGAYIEVVGHRGASGDITVTVAGDLPALASSALDFTTLGLIPGEWVYVGGDATANKFANAVNNGFKRVRSVAANLLTFDKSASAMVTDAGASKLIDLYFGKVIKNESDPTLIVRSTYQFERTLGAPDSALPSQIQSEYVTGCVPSELELTIPTAEKLTASLKFVGTGYETRSGATGVKSGTRESLVEADCYNSSVDAQRTKLSVVSSTDEAVTPLFAFVTELKLTINNNVKPSKAVGVLGAFDASVGTFAVSGEITAYFADVAAVAAVSGNSDVTLDVQVTKNNAGLVVDLPLIALGDGKLQVEQDEAIKIPLKTDAATGRSISTSLDHTMLWNFFSYLPTAAM
jgi:hypothetical protein